MDVWLRPNRRILLLGLIPAGLVAGLGVGFAAGTEPLAARAFGWVLIALGSVLFVGLVMQLTRPRVAFGDGKVLFFLQARRPVETPVEAVEAFFIGQGATHLPGAVLQDAETANLVARISQQYPEWSDVTVKPALGCWKGGYATIRGTWCEPLTNDVVRRINRLLREAQESVGEESGTNAAAKEQ